MNRFPSIKRYSRLSGQGNDHNDAFTHQSWLSSSAPQTTDQHGYEMHDRKVPAKSIASTFVEELPSLSQPKYTPVDNYTDGELPKGLEEDHIGAGKVNTGYNPLFTRRWVLLCFALLWLLIIASLQILYSVSQSQNGIATTDSSLRYLWTYGPTAFLVIITVVWRQVDYAAKYVQPWACLAGGPLSAQKTLLLDYITPFQVVAFWKALRLRHVTVAATILVFVLIKALTVISTGLLTLEVIQFENRPQTMHATTVFDGSRGLPLDSIDSRAAVGLYGAKTYSMQLPYGTTENYAFQLFEPSIAPPKDTYAFNATVDVFVADGWECETGELTYENATDHNDVGDGTGLWENTPVMFYWNTTVKLPDCEIHNGHLDAPGWYYEQNSTVEYWGYWGIFHNVNCSNLEDTDPKKQRYMISVAYSHGVGQDDNVMLNSSNIVCRPSYGIQPGLVKMFTNGTVDGSVVPTGTKRQLDNISPDDLARAVYRTVQSASIPKVYDSWNVTADAYLDSMIRLTPDFEVEMLMDNNWLTNKSQEAFQQYAAQIAGLYLVADSTNAPTFAGSIARNEVRLVVKKIPTRSMQSCAAVMLALTLLMMLTMPRHVVPRSVESIAAVAVVLARSPSLIHVLRHTGHLDEPALVQVLGRHRYMSIVADAPHGKTFSIRVISDTEPLVPAKEHSHIKWKQPPVVRRIVMSMTLILAVCILIALEVLYRYSEAHSGIADVNVNSLQKYAWTYSPVVVLVLLATTFNILDFELEFADPYHELSRGYTSASKSLLWDPLRNITPKTCIEAFRKSRYALVASSIAVLFAPLLTISVSGLFSARPVPHTQISTPSTETWFNISEYTGTYAPSSGAFAIPSLILQGNMSYPQWTYGELAFPSIDLSQQSTGINNITGGFFNVETVAARGAINCTLVPEDQYANRTVGDADFIEVNVTFANKCGNTGYDWQPSSYMDTNVDIPPSGSGFFGSTLFGWGYQNDSYTGEMTLCPSFFLAYGEVENRDIKNWAMYSCYTGWETVEANATVSADLSTVVADPIVVDGSAKSFMDFWQPESSSGSLGTGQFYFSQINRTHTDEAFDSVVDVMVYGRDGIPPIELLNGDTLIKQFSHTYRQWTAQWLNTYMRNPVADLAKNATNTAGTLPTKVNSEYSNNNRQRLFLSEVSTRILQGVIAVLLVCGIVIFILVDMRNVLPKPVGSVGAVCSLLAGSRLVDERSGLIPHGSEWPSDREMKRRGMWAGEMFRMGWWPQDGAGVDKQSDTSYAGAAGHMNMSPDEKRAEEFKIDARPRIEYSS